MTPLELVAVVCSLASVVLAVRQHPGTWPTGIVAVIAYAVVFWRTRLYADMVLQAVFLSQSVYGWWHWTRGTVVMRAARVTSLTMRTRGLLILIIPVGIVTLSTGLSRWTDAASPTLDATVSILSLVANGLLAKRILDTWPLWVLADVLYVALFVSKGLHLSAVLYTAFLVLALIGWRAWWREFDALRPAGLRDVRALTPDGIK